VIDPPDRLSHRKKKKIIILFIVALHTDTQNIQIDRDSEEERIIFNNRNKNELDLVDDNHIDSHSIDLAKDCSH
jgi:hypothetical protein